MNVKLPNNLQFRVTLVFLLVSLIPLTVVSVFSLQTADGVITSIVTSELENVAAERGVTMNTVRSQLKQVFSKTDTSRQGELVHLVLTGIASLRNGDAS